MASWNKNKLALQSAEDAIYTESILKKKGMFHFKRTKGEVYQKSEVLIICIDDQVVAAARAPSVCDWVILCGKRNEYSQYSNASIRNIVGKEFLGVCVPKIVC